ncbi:MAG: hypothetical protein IKV21_00685 [Clostridia bacterium]|nr:hypothetical protein [Clostridia bacterium]
MKKLWILFTALALLLSHFMCIFVAYNYRGFLCAIEHEGFSAPADIVFLYAIPFVAAIVLFAVLAVRFYKKGR